MTDDKNAKPQNAAALEHRLRMAANAGDIATIKTLVTEQGVDVNARDDLGWSPLMRAVSAQQLDAVKELLLLNADAQIRTSDNGTFLHLAACGDDDQKSAALIQMLLGATPSVDINTRDHRGNTPLHEGVIAGNTSAIQALLANGASAFIKNNVPPNHGKTALDLARQQQCRPILRLIEKARDTRERS